MKLIVGLGNPGEKYANSRHNVGFMVVDTLLRKLVPAEKTSWKEDRKSNSQLYILHSKLILAKPQTMMNASGFAIVKLVNFYHVDPAEVWVIHDDLDLPLGKIKIRKGGGTAGHHGLDSIIRELGKSEFIRFRLGIGKPVKKDKNIKHREVERYVLEGFIGKELVEAEKMIKRAAEAIELALVEGIEKSMNKFNLK